MTASLQIIYPLSSEHTSPENKYDCPCRAADQEKKAEWVPYKNVMFVIALSSKAYRKKLKESGGYI